MIQLIILAAVATLSIPVLVPQQFTVVPFTSPWLPIVLMFAEIVVSATFLKILYPRNDFIRCLGFGFAFFLVRLLLCLVGGAFDTRVDPLRLNVPEGIGSGLSIAITYMYPTSWWAALAQYVSMLFWMPLVLEKTLPGIFPPRTVVAPPVAAETSSILAGQTAARTSSILAGQTAAKTSSILAGQTAARTSSILATQTVDGEAATQPTEDPSQLLDRPLILPKTFRELEEELAKYPNLLEWMLFTPDHLPMWGSGSGSEILEVAPEVLRRMGEVCEPLLRPEWGRTLRQGVFQTDSGYCLLTTLPGDFLFGSLWNTEVGQGGPSKEILQEVVERTEQMLNYRFSDLR